MTLNKETKPSQFLRITLSYDIYRSTTKSELFFHIVKAKRSLYHQQTHDKLR